MTVLRLKYIKVVMSSRKIPSYEVVDLGTLGGEESRAFGMNNRGQVVGAADLKDGVSRAFVWEGDSLRKLDAPVGRASKAHSINANGQVVGSAQGSRGGHLPCLWDQGVIRLLDGDDGPDGMASHINDAGQIAGWRDRTPDRVRGGPELAILWHRSQSIELCTANRFGRDAYSRFGSSAWGINNKGQVVGKTPGGSAFLCQEGDFTLFELVTGEGACATAINEMGQVAGWGYINETQVHAFLWEQGRIKDLGSLGGSDARASDVNIHGHVVGDSAIAELDESAESIEDHGFLWRDELLMDLNYLIAPNTGWLITAANSINDAGWIAGTGIRGGVAHAVLMTPR
ncbi:MAG: hypothetical protein J5J06_04090 [Phycisphaerae bacterium]|nr:hypothetical protein [Phycisphaerae bacterium]